MTPPPVKKLRLMQITHDLAIGGLQQVVVNLCRHIDRERFQLSVLCLKALGEFASEIEEMGIPVFLLPQTKSTDYFSFIKVTRLLRKERIDVIHTHNTQPFVDGTLGGVLAGVKTIVHTDHGRAFPDKWRYMASEWALSYFASRVVGVSGHTTANLRRYERIPIRKLTTVLNGISGEKFAVGVDRKAKKKELGITQEGPVIGYCGRLSEEKGVVFLLRAMPEISARIPGVSLLVAGKGDEEEQLRKEAYLLGVGPRVYFMGPRRDIPELLNLMDLLVLPSLREGLPMVIPEAMAAGCPVLASRVGGIPSVIENGQNGSLVEPGKPDQIALEAIALLLDGTLRKAYRYNGLRSYRKKYSAETMTGHYEKLYSGCLG